MKARLVEQRRFSADEVRRALGLPPLHQDPVTPIPKRRRFYRTHGGYYALRIGRRWLYRYQGKWRFSEYANVID